jgi:uncharacterized membrane protein
MFCHNCGAQVAVGDSFCPVCGASQEGAAPVASRPWTPAPGIQAHTGQWIGQGWRLVMDNLGIFVLAALVIVLLGSVMSTAHFRVGYTLGFTPSVIIQGPLLAGFYIICILKMTGRPADLSDLFSGFHFFVPALVATLVVDLFTLAGTLLCIIPGIVIFAMYMFTYLFIVDKRMDFWPAMRASHAIVRNDYFGFSMFLLTMILVNLLGVLCCFVGVLVSMPVTLAAIAAASRDIVGFEQRTPDAL